MKTKKQNKFYEETLFIIATLILIFPIGLFLMFKYNKFNKKARYVILTICMSPIIIAAINKILPQRYYTSKKHNNNYESSKPIEQKNEDISLVDSTEVSKEKGLLENKLKEALSDYNVTSIDILNLTAGGYSAMINVETDISEDLGQMLYDEISNKINGIVNEYYLTIIKDYKVIAN